MNKRHSQVRPLKLVRSPDGRVVKCVFTNENFLSRDHANVREKAKKGLVPETRRQTATLMH